MKTQIYLYIFRCMDQKNYQPNQYQIDRDNFDLNQPLSVHHFDNSKNRYFCFSL